MFKKIEIWILYLVIILFTILLIAYGSLLKEELIKGQKDRIAYKVVNFISDLPSNFSFLIKNWSGVDLSVEKDRYVEKKGFIKHNFKPRNELLLLSRYDGDLKRSVIELIDLKNFSIIHSWTPNVNTILKLTENKKEFEKFKIEKNSKSFRLFNPLLTDNGNIIFQGFSPLVKIDFCSNILWINDEDIFHHSIEKDYDGNFWIPTQNYPSSIAKYIDGIDINSFTDDGITKISKENKILYNKSVTEILFEHNLENMIIGKLNTFSNDPIHLNDIEPVLKDGPFWKKGDVFLSLRHQSIIILFRPNTNKIIRIISGPFFQQHDVDILSEEEISIFNNNTIWTPKGEVIKKNSEIIIYNFKTNQFTKKFNDQLIRLSFKSETEGLHHILNDSSLFLEEQNYGRILLLNNKGDLEWEYINRAKNGKVYILNWSSIIDDYEFINYIKKIIKNNKC
jgi:hypothetical protein